MFTTTSPKTLPGLITALKRDPNNGPMTDTDLEDILQLHYQAWNRYRWFFGSVAGWEIYQHQLTMIPTHRYNKLEETNPTLFQRYDDEFMRNAYYYDDIIEPATRRSPWRQYLALEYKLLGPSPRPPDHN